MKDSVSQVPLTPRAWAGETPTAAPEPEATKESGTSLPRPELPPDLHAGDLVIHEQHGLGRYHGLRTLRSDGRNADFLLLEYAEGRRLYVPIEAVDQISKYRGAATTLDDLGRRRKVQRQEERVQALPPGTGSLDPRNFADVVGQSQAVSRLEAIKDRSRITGPIHVLLTGGEGTGKRTLASVFANESGSRFTAVSAASIQRVPDLMGILTNLGDRDVLFIENLDRLPRLIEDVLRSALRDFAVDFVMDKGLNARTHRCALKPFTCIGAADAEANVSPGVRSLFPVTIALDLYDEAEMSALAQAIGRARGLSLSAGGAALLARLARGSAQQLKSMLQLIAARDQGEVSDEEAARILSALGFDVKLGSSEGAQAEPIAAELSKLSGVEFERLIGGLLSRMGFRTELTRATGDGGIDIVALLDRPVVGGKYLVQCKRFAPENLVTAPIVREFYGAFVADQAAVKGILMTTSDFTEQAKAFAKGRAIELINGEELHALLKTQGNSSG
jgi:Holliday junction resolvasome RuvABC ATP-dependent DNA helicase subunit